MATTGVDIVSLDWTVDMAEALARLPEHIIVQQCGSRPSVWFPKRSKPVSMIVCARPAAASILNLGHGILPGTPEENGAAFFRSSVMDRLGAS